MRQEIIEAIVAILTLVFVMAVGFAISYLLALVFTWLTPVSSDHTFTVAVGLFIIHLVTRNSGSNS